MGRSDVYASEFDLDADEFVPMPKGEVHKTKGKIPHFYAYPYLLESPQDTPIYETYWFTVSGKLPIIILCRDCSICDAL